MVLAVAAIAVLGLWIVVSGGRTCPGGSDGLLLREGEVRSAPTLRAYRAVEDPLGGLYAVESDASDRAGIPGLCDGAEQVFMDDARGWLSVNVLTMDAPQQATSFVQALPERWPGGTAVDAPPGVTAFEVTTTAGPTIVAGFVVQTHAVVIGVAGHDVDVLDAQARHVVATVRGRESGPS